jgi:nucleotide-binding universal stress UspA family protein
MYDKILVPVDGSPTSELGLAEAIQLARLTGARLRLLHAIDMVSFSMTADAGMAASPELFEQLREAGRDVLARAKARATDAGVTAETVLLDTLAARVCDLVVEDASRCGADLIVIGTHGRRGMGRLVLGSDAEQIVRLSPVPVLLVRSKGLASEPMPHSGGISQPKGSS